MYPKFGLANKHRGKQVFVGKDAHSNKICRCRNEIENKLNALKCVHALEMMI